MKICSVCKIEKDETEFFKKGRILQARCKTCKKNYEQDLYLNRGGAARCKAHREKTKEYQKRTQKVWRSQNQGVKNFHTAKYRALKKQATPNWLTEEHLEQIKGFYKKARELTEQTGTNHHVDHIYPLNGKICSGLHVPWNLQILTEKENLVKSNSMEG